MTDLLSSLSTLVTVIAQLGMAAGALKLARALKDRVDDHEHRITSLERYECPYHVTDVR